MTRKICQPSADIMRPSA